MSACQATIELEPEPIATPGVYIPHPANVPTRTAMAAGVYDDLLATTDAREVHDAIVAAGYARVTPPDDDGTTTQAINAGMPESRFPATGKLLIKQPGLDNGYCDAAGNCFTCTATAIGPNTILTAAHCVDRTGTFTFERVGGQRYNVYKLNISPDTDVATLWIDTPITGTSFPKIGVATVGSGYRAIGYGIDDALAVPAAGVRRSAAMRVAAIAPAPWPECVENPSESACQYLTKIPDETIALRGIDGCPNHGDSGGPLVRETNGVIANEVLGVTSFGWSAYPHWPSCLSYTTIYAHVGTLHNRDFIERHMAPTGGAPAWSATMPDHYKVQLGQTLAIKLDARDPNGDPLTYRAPAGLPAGGTWSQLGAQFSWATAGATPGTYSITFRAFDGSNVADTAIVVEVVGADRIIVRNGDANVDGRVDIADAQSVLGYAYNATPISCAAAGDVDDRAGSLAATDATAILDWLYKGETHTRVPLYECGTRPATGGVACAKPMTTCAHVSP